MAERLTGSSYPRLGQLRDHPSGQAQLRIAGAGLQTATLEAATWVIQGNPAPAHVAHFLRRLLFFAPLGILFLALLGILLSIAAAALM